MDQETRNAISQKADQYKVHDLERDRDRLNNKLNDAHRQISALEARLQNHYSVIEQLLTLLAEKDTECADTFLTWRNQL